jgi:hypothetical protein
MRIWESPEVSGKAWLLNRLFLKGSVMENEKEKIFTLAQQLKAKLEGSTAPVVADENAAELVESQLDAVSGGAHGSVHLSGTI